MKPPPSAIVAAKEKAFDDLRSGFPRRPDPPAHHVRIEELHDAMATMPNLKNRVSLSNLVDIVCALNAKLDARATPAEESRHG